LLLENGCKENFKNPEKSGDLWKYPEKWSDVMEDDNLAMQYSHT